MLSRVAATARSRLQCHNSGSVSAADAVLRAAGGGRRLFSSTTPARADFTHVVIGGGVVGLSTARALSEKPGTSTLLLERHNMVGTETSSRNSEVIHAGLYYGANSLKTRLCVEGKQKLYDFCARHAVPHANTGKWIVAQDEGQREGIEKIHAYCRDEIGVPTRFVGEEEARRLEPEVRGRTGILESPTTGIVDSHGLMVALQGVFEEEGGGTTALSSAVVAVEPLPYSPGGGGSKPGSGGWKITVRDVSTGEESAIETETLVNCAGLGAAEVNNLIVDGAGLEAERKLRLYYAKGNYFSYASSLPKVSRLVYPAPTPGLGGLGTHLTLDMGGRIRFGPDVEWVEDPGNLQVNDARFPLAVQQIREFLPNVQVDALAPDYAGIRPKLSNNQAVGTGKGFADFYIRREDGCEGWVNLLGIESPGLTSSIAIGDLVKDIMYGSASGSGSLRT